MALNALLAVTLSNDGQDLILQDITVYGDGVTDPSRVQSLVDFVVVHKLSAGDLDLTPSYDNTQDFNVTPLSVPITKDGYYEITITITHNPADSTWTGGDYTYTTTEKRVVLWNSNKMYNDNILDIVKDSLCGCEDRAALFEVMLLAAKIDAADDLGCIDLDLVSAQLVVENIEETCNC